MKHHYTKLFFIALLLAMSLPAPALAHVTPNIRLITTREAVATLLPEGRLFVKDVELTREQNDKLRSMSNWALMDNQSTQFKFYVTRDDKDQIRRAMVMMTELTRHGPVVVAVALDDKGTVAGALLTDIQNEPLSWVEPLLRTKFMDSFAGKTSAMSLDVPAPWNEQPRITQDYAVVISNAVKKAAQLYEVVFK